MLKELDKKLLAASEKGSVDEIQNKTEDKGYLDGKNGIDTLNLQGIKEKNMELSLDQKLKVKSNLPELRNIENANYKKS